MESKGLAKTKTTVQKEGGSLDEKVQKEPDSIESNLMLESWVITSPHQSHLIHLSPQVARVQKQKPTIKMLLLLPAARQVRRKHPRNQLQASGLGMQLYGQHMHRIAYD